MNKSEQDPPKVINKFETILSRSFRKDENVIVGGDGQSVI